MTFIRTLTQDIQPSELGVTYAHDHIYCLPPYWQSKGEADLLLDDAQASGKELADFVACGGQSIYDATAPDYGRDVRVVAALAQQYQVNIIATAGLNKGFLWSSRYPHAKTHPHCGESFAQWIERHSVEQISQHIAAEVVVGIEGTAFRAGVIKCGTGYNQISPLEHKVMQATALAVKETGAPMHCHTEMGTMALEQLAILKQQGVDLSRVGLAHLDRNPDPWLHQQIAKTGAFLCFDGMSRIKYFPEHIRSQALIALCKKGYQQQILIGGDFARKSMSAHYGLGGLGLAYILRDWRPRFVQEAHAEGLDGEALLHDFFVANPARYLQFA
ncbi:Phospho-furanose lactonase [Vibrio stylophorae]|uniref:Phospho-furanose lactonase n=1 Tax=Vibrio stylophorae TaxID=659351 RepID=A0ABN8DZV4_9VIBR|nr:phosphotriesterase [Vibrio stylophorae]CAH0535248.1 Phospho-furanose lactonase [Vibrio stylophorae]